VIAKLVWPGHRADHASTPVDSLWVECSADEAHTQIAPLLNPSQKSRLDKFLADPNYVLQQAAPGLPVQPGAIYFLVKQDLSVAEAFPWVYPYAGQWNAYCPFRVIRAFAFSNLSELSAHRRFTPLRKEV